MGYQPRNERPRPLGYEESGSKAADIFGVLVAGIAIGVLQTVFWVLMYLFITGRVF